MPAQKVFTTNPIGVRTASADPSLPRSSMLPSSEIQIYSSKSKSVAFVKIVSPNTLPLPMILDSY
uniref:Uncharacterized protein n=1 Tax=Megaselia scalaris TaxID=36166 RepID=T1GNX3_MEGSC